MSSKNAVAQVSRAQRKVIRSENISYAHGALCVGKIRLIAVVSSGITVAMLDARASRRSLQRYPAARRLQGCIRDLRHNRFPPKTESVH